MQPRRFLALLAATLTLLPAVAHAVPPVNDNFANRIVLNGQAVSSGPITIDEATREGLEPSDSSFKSVWWTWTAPIDGSVTLTTEGTPIFNRLRVWMGNDLANLTLIDLADNFSNRLKASNVTFPVKAGFTYQISVGASDSNDTGTVTLNLRAGPSNLLTAPTVVGVPARGNDNFAQAVELPGSTVTGFTYNTSTSREGQEPASTRQQTVWWKWTAPADVNAKITTAGTNFYAYLSVFNGNDLSSLTTVDLQNGSPATSNFPAKAGFVYYIAVGRSDSDGPGGVPFVNITTVPLSITSPIVIGSLANVNDNYSNAQSLGSYQTVSGFGYNYDATVESLESRNTGSRTLWWTWTAPASGKLGVTLQGTDFNHVLSIFTGDTIGSAVLKAYVRGPDRNGAAFGEINDIPAGTTIHFAIGGSGSGEYGNAVLNLNFVQVGVQNPPFFSGQTPLDNGVYFLRFGGTNNPFGYYSYLSDPHYIFHFDLGYEYVFDANDGRNGVYLYDFKSNGFFYTSPSFPFPYLYDFSLKTVIYYFPNPNNEGRYNTNGIRYFVRLDTGQIFSK